jgi:hypothetical protein
VNNSYIFGGNLLCLVAADALLQIQAAVILTAVLPVPPAVFHRKNHCNWLVTMELEDFIKMYREWE